ncbi:MAG: hypothetical protein ACPIOQ_45890, partial [Promethearchaeia archaeon]
MPFASTWMSLLVVVGLQALGTAGDLLPVNRRTDMVGRKPVTIWPLSDAAQMHVHSPELAQALPRDGSKTLQIAEAGVQAEGLAALAALCQSRAHLDAYAKEVLRGHK